MTHRAESILDAIETAVTGLTTTGANVKRGIVWPVNAFPAIRVIKRADLADGDSVVDVLQRTMTVDL